MNRKIIILFLVTSTCAYYAYYLHNLKYDEIPTGKALIIEAQESTKQKVTPKNQFEQDITLESPIEENYSIPEDMSIENEYGDNFDLYYYALVIHGLAEDGDAQKQFELAYTLSICEAYILIREWRDIPERYRDPLLVDEIQNWWFSRCAGFDRENIAMFGNSEEWYEKSAINGYAPAVALRFLLEENFIRTEEKLATIHQAITTKQYETFSFVGALSKNNETKLAWTLLSCEYGYDCSGTSKESWRISALLAYCSLIHYSGEACDTNMTYAEYLKEAQPQDKFQKIMSKKDELKDIIESGLISELTWETMLD